MKNAHVLGIAVMAGLGLAVACTESSSSCITADDKASAEVPLTPIVARATGTASKSGTVELSELVKTKPVRGPFKKHKSREDRPKLQQPVPQKGSPLTVSSHLKSFTLKSHREEADSFAATDNTDFGQGVPDTQGAVSSQHLLLAHNNEIRIQDRTGKVIATLPLITPILK